MRKVSVPQVVTSAGASELPLPAAIQEALGELVGAAREGLFSLSVGVGLGVVHELMAAEVDEVVGAKGKHDRDRTAKRHGHERGSMTLGGRRVEVRRPRIRTADDEHELPVETYEYFADRDPLTRAVMDRVLAGVSTRRCASVGEPVGEEVEQNSSSTSKSTVSELFVERTRTALGELMSRRLDDVRLAVMMLDGLEIADRTHVVALGITTEGVKIPLGLWEGSTENATLARTLLADLVDRGLDPEQAILFVIDGGKAIRRALKDVFGEHALVHRCHRHKERNVCDLLPERERPQVLARIRGAWSLTEPELARQRLELLASELQRTWPDAAGSLREGLDETLTLMRLGVTGHLSKTLCSTNPCESMLEIVRHTQRNVKRWQDGDMHKRWTAAGMLVAEQQFRRIVGYRDLATLVIAIKRHAARTTLTPASEQTLNQILVEMDGFEQGQNVIVLAATNRADVLDPALLRPGRFDRRVHIGLPERADREAILKEHLKKKPVAKSVDISALAGKTAGSSGADLANIANEAAILAARKNSKEITNTIITEAFEKVAIGPERKSKVMSDKEKELTAYHEAGHALVGHVMPNSDPIHKVTIIPRGGTGGVTWAIPPEDKSYHSIIEFKDVLARMLGGRIAEELIYGPEWVTTGAGSDLPKAAELARDMIINQGMGSKKLRNQVFHVESGMMFERMTHEKQYSEETAKLIDDEVESLIAESATRARDVIKSNLKYLEKLKTELLEKETIDAEDVVRICKGSRLPKSAALY